MRKELNLLAEWILTLTSDDSLQAITLNSPASSHNNSSLKLARYSSKNEDISQAIQQDNRHELESLLQEGTRVRGQEKKKKTYCTKLKKN